MSTKKLQVEKMVECDACNYLMTEQEYEDMPQCPNCRGHYVEVIQVILIQKDRRKTTGDRREKSRRTILAKEFAERVNRK